ncbi:glycosyltransferase family 4 protein [Cereibacter sphaeroides]|uniref:glycosyltransferase family 4 protein n=1 Tax=Cereibacter sphaeroides TaxID=1063 RepID=UPI001F340966|nr:glycosyltransferase family 4 protein [Cereibacter sphaeroides]MCE6949622.1 glycosyltransferase family 4 protein [Cereibacter sphaeroides]
MRELLLLSLDYPPNDGGISRLVSEAVAALEAAGQKTRVVTFASGGRTGLPRPESEVAEVDRRKGLRDLQLLQLVRRHLRQYGPDAPIVTSVWSPEATLAMLAGARRVTILAHGNEVMPYRRQVLKTRLRRLVLGRAKMVVCNSRFTESLVRQIAPQARTAVLNPAIDADHYHPPMSRAGARQHLGLPLTKRIVLTVARLDPIKGHETMLRAMAELTEAARADLLYVIIGKGEMRDPLTRLAHELGLAAQVHFAGFVADADLSAWYGAADLFVLPSVVDSERGGMEGFGMALTEAQAAGLPVIGTRSGGIPDAVREGDGGWLIPERDHIALASHVRRLLDAPDVFAEQGRRGAERVRREMTWAGYAQRLMELI